MTIVASALIDYAVGQKGPYIDDKQITVVQRSWKVGKAELSGDYDGGGQSQYRSLTL